MCFGLAEVIDERREIMNLQTKTAEYEINGHMVRAVLHYGREDSAFEDGVVVTYEVDGNAVDMLLPETMGFGDDEDSCDEFNDYKDYCEPYRLMAAEICTLAAQPPQPSPVA